MASARAPSRRFLPGDPRVEEPYRLTPQLALRVAILGFLALALFAVLFLRLWALQVLSGDRYLAQANDNRVRTLRLEAPRGPILDRNGRVLVTNVAGHARRAVAGRPAEDVGGAARGAAAARDGDRRARRRRSSRSSRKHGDDPLTPVVVQRGIKQRPDLLPLEHQDAVPRRAARRTATCASTRTSRSPRRCSATSARSRPRSTRR